MISQIRDIEVAELRQMWRPRSPFAHKGTMGHALLIAGSRGMAGAAILASEACLRSGIGKLSILTPEDNRQILQITVPEAIVKTDCDLQGFNALGIGPGIGLDMDRVKRCLEVQGTPMVFDADALNILAKEAQWQDLIPMGSILTPHPLEAERLTGSRLLEDIAQYAIRHKIFIVLKGHPTHVCTPQGEILRLRVGNAGMATAGSGDVLTGIITGLLAQGYTPCEAALLGTWIHGTAGDFSADEMGENCMLARDIIRHMPAAFRKLTAHNN